MDSPLHKQNTTIPHFLSSKIKPPTVKTQPRNTPTAPMPIPTPLDTHSFLHPPSAAFSLTNVYANCAVGFGPPLSVTSLAPALAAATVPDVGVEPAARMESARTSSRRCRV
ncbi:hypothetical protein RHS01_00135 [Rhizoctonia solani]|uniref:Uncharacterized protein n=1 Tax=Rhizoctonia solani TaxID=456999 RepID=A0A8H7M5H9_9AGAM|nr:hypothetical protein RHS01_00135 [Rhizoctonia solani]